MTARAVCTTRAAGRLLEAPVDENIFPHHCARAKRRLRAVAGAAGQPAKKRKARSQVALLCHYPHILMNNAAHRLICRIVQSRGETADDVAGLADE